MRGITALAPGIVALVRRQTEWDDGTVDDVLTLTVRQIEILPDLP